MRKLSIEAKGTKLYKNSLGNVKINNVGVEDMIYENLPVDMEEYKDYVVNTKIVIEFVEIPDPVVMVTTDGYEAKKEEESEAEVIGEGN